MRFLLLAITLFLGALPPVSAAEPVFAENFDAAPESGIPADWESSGAGQVTREPGLGSNGLGVRIGPAAGNHLVSRQLPVEKLRGMRLSVSAKARAENISKPPKIWNGLKLMLYTKSPTAGESWEQAPAAYGSFGWTPLGFAVGVPADATEAKLFLGLEDCSGSVVFEDVRITITAKPRSPREFERPLISSSFDPVAARTSRLRGVMYGPKGKEEDLRELARWGANHIRWQFYWHPGGQPGEGRRDLKAYDAWLEETMTEVERYLPLCQELGIQVLIDLHTPPGGGHAGQWLIFSEREYQEYFIAAWDKMAARFKDQPAVWGYDLVNEPSEGFVGPDLMGWRDLAEHVAKRVRAIDPRKVIVIEPGQNGGWSNLPYFEPIPVPGIVYSVHVYDPLQFTHQGILDGFPAGVTYPGEVLGKRWDREALRAHLQAVREYSLDYNVPIYIGEFSAPRWAPGDSSATYLRDCIAIFEEFGWSWSYHAFREWHGWNVEIVDGKGEHDPPAPPDQPTARKQALLEGFRLNKP